MASAVKVKSGFTLARLNLDRRLKDEESYQHQLSKLQIAMLGLEQIYRVEGRRGIIAVEGWDASGKGGAIQRLTEKLDPRWVQVWPIGKPSPEEQGRHFLWRFWQRLPPPGNNRDLRPSLVRTGSGRARRSSGPPERVAAGL
jgi:AMP-polyphosphate phosphotransferase